MQLFALHSVHSLEKFQVSGENLRRKNMVGQYVHKLALVLWFQQALQGSCRQRSKSCIIWGENSEITR